MCINVEIKTLSAFVKLDCNLGFHIGQKTFLANDPTDALTKISKVALTLGTEFVVNTWSTAVTTIKAAIGIVGLIIAIPISNQHIRNIVFINFRLETCTL